MTEIAVLDGFTLNPGDLSWAELETLGSCRVYDRTDPAELIERAREAEIVLTNKTPLSRATLASLPALRYVGVMATGVNVVDLDAARERGLVVTNVPAYSTPSVVQMVFAHLLNLTQQVGRHARAVAAGRWSASPDFCFTETPLIELEGLSFGIVGLGRIGAAVAAVARSFGMRVLFHTPTEREGPEDCRWVPLPRLLSESDVVSLHCPLDETTRGLIDEHSLARMKPSAFLINTGRGPLVDEAALARALDEGRIAGAGLDVLAAEPPPADHPLLSAKNCFITPHIAWATRAARGRLMQVVVENVRAYQAGAPRNRV